MKNFTKTKYDMNPGASLGLAPKRWIFSHDCTTLESRRFICEVLSAMLPDGWELYPHGWLSIIREGEELDYNDVRTVFDAVYFLANLDGKLLHEVTFFLTALAEAKGGK